MGKKTCIFVVMSDTHMTVFGGQISETSFVPDEGMEWDAYQKAFTAFRGLNRAARWVLGDLLNYGEHHFSDRYTQLIDATDYDIDTLTRAKRIAQVYPVEDRRAALTWGHHREVVDLPRPKRIVLLDHAEREHLSVHALRALRRQLLSKGNNRLPEDVAQILKAASQEAAKLFETTLDDVDVAEWSDSVTVLRSDRWVRCAVTVRFEDQYSAVELPAEVLDGQVAGSPPQEADQ